MIDEKRLLEVLEKNFCGIGGVEVLKQIINEQPKVGEWIPCSERLPEEHDSMFAKFKGTNKWNTAMFEKSSDEVIVTIEFGDGKRKTTTSKTMDGMWKIEKDIFSPKKVIAWQPLPEPYKGEPK